MPPLPPTSLAVAAAVEHLRTQQQLTTDELAFVTVLQGTEICADRLRAIERGEASATVDELLILAVALYTTPAALLSFVPEDSPLPDHQLATAVPSDVDQQELRAWLEGRTALDHESRVRWAEDRVQRLEIRSAHVEDQLQAAYEELRELGELADQEADALPVIRLRDRIQGGGYDLTQMNVALAYAEQRLGWLQEEW
ncbi:hypothetical protein [Brachybacterium hainanense]|uniref:HTH cro/C1-type domain-containing protein n=1 Tax=Brachybacterium hainanense TaxID=1541174 RepID=A0ABV6RFD5_9MICO